MTIDINCSFGPGLASQPEVFGPLYPPFSIEQLVAELDRAGIDIAALAAPAWMGGDFVDPYYEAANESVHDAVRENPDRFFGIGRANPSFGARGLAVAGRALDDYGFRGLLLDPEVDRFSPLDGATLGPYLALCRRHEVPLLVVTGIHPAQPMTFLPLADAYPDVTIIMLRMGAYVPEDAIIAAKLARNIVLETSGQTPLEVRRAIAELGPDRVLFGSGFPFADAAVERLKISRLPGLTAPELDSVLGGNAAKLFGLTQASGAAAARPRAEGTA